MGGFYRSKKIFHDTRKENDVKKVNSVIRYFDLASDLRSKSAVEKSEKTSLPPVLPQYIALVLGILIQPFFVSYQQSGAWQFDGFWGRLLFSVIAGIAVLPGAYKKSFDPEKPVLVQLCLLFVAGMGWQSLLSTAIKAVGP
jgi:hypothetical protein